MKGSIAEKLRQGWRSVALVCVFAGAGLDHYARGGSRLSLAQRARWTQRWATQFRRALGFDATVLGTPPTSGFILPNHLSYIDIVVLGSLAPQIFLSKQDVQGWPIIGAYVRMAGTIFIDRARRREVAGKDEAFAQVIEAGSLLTVFLEGTSSDGSQVLPFRASLLEPLARNGWQVTPAYLRYECDDGDVSTEVCWWGGMTFGAHLLNMMRLKRVRATVAFGETRVATGDRKALADRLREETLALRARVEGAGERAASVLGNLGSS